MTERDQRPPPQRGADDAETAAAAAGRPSSARPLVEVRAEKYDGRLHRRWDAQIVAVRDPLIVLRGSFAEEVRHPLLGVVERGTVSTEYYWLDRWYSVFRFVRPAGSLRNYYCNINLPPVFDSARGRFSFVDLDIDLLVAPDLAYRVLDEDEFEHNARLYGYPPEVTRGARAALGELISLVETRSFPFAAADETFARTL